MLPKTEVKIFRITIIFMHAPTEHKVNTVESFFYDTLDRVYQSLNMIQ